jgi:K+/H+ antiporter YhaU regulatory subunit KhtT
MIAEGVDVFRVKTPKAIKGKTIKYASVQEECGCSIIGVSTNQSTMINPFVETILPEDGEIIFIGTVESEEKLFRRYKPEV